MNVSRFEAKIAFARAALLFDCLMLRDDIEPATLIHLDESVHRVSWYLAQSEDCISELAEIAHTLHGQLTTQTLDEIVAELRTIQYLMAIRSEEHLEYLRNFCTRCSCTL